MASGGCLRKSPYVCLPFSSNLGAYLQFEHVHSKSHFNSFSLLLKPSLALMLLAHLHLPTEFSPRNTVIAIYRSPPHLQHINYSFDLRSIALNRPCPSVVVLHLNRCRKTANVSVFMTGRPSKRIQKVPDAPMTKSTILPPRISQITPGTL